MSTASPPGATLVARRSPAGRVLLGPEQDPAPPVRVERVTAAFERGSACGLLRLGAADLDADLDPTLAFWRERSRQLVTAICAALDPTDPAARVLPDADPAALSALVTAAPPMRGAGLLTPRQPRRAVSEGGTAVFERSAEREGGVQGLRASCRPV